MASWTAEEELSPLERERQQLETIARWERRRPCDRLRRFNAARRRAGLPLVENARTDAGDGHQTGADVARPIPPTL